MTETAAWAQLPDSVAMQPPILETRDLKVHFPVQPGMFRRVHETVKAVDGVSFDLAPGETARIFPLSNLTEFDVWSYIAAEGIDVVPLYFAAERPTVIRQGQIIVVDDDRMRLEPGERPENRMVRFRSLGCYPLSAAIPSNATDLDALLAEMRETRQSERAGRLIDQDQDASMERKKREGYF